MASAASSAKSSDIPVIGITGGVGSGKSSVAQMFACWGGWVLSADDIGRRVIDQSVLIRKQLAAAFGSDIFHGQKLNRALLAERAFSNRDSTLLLNQIVHPPLLQMLNSSARRAKRSKANAAVVIDAALLPEWGRDRVSWDVLVGVWAPLHLRRERLLAKGWSADTIHARGSQQMSWTRRRTYLDFVVKNDGSLADLEPRARLCWKKIVSCDGRVGDGDRWQSPRD